MNKYKIVSLFLAISLIATLVHLVATHASNEEQTDAAASTNRSEVVMQNILSRKSVRSYTEQPVSREQLDTLVRAAMAAPTGRDMRPWKFVVITNKATITQLNEALPRAKMLAEAQAVIAICGDMSVKDDEGKSSKNWTLDCSAATENLLLMAEAMGLGAVWVGVYPYEDRTPAVQKVLELPDHLIPLNVIPIGYPKGNPQPKDKYTQDNVIER